MKKRYFLLITLSLIFVAACETEEYLTCPDNVTQVLDLNECPKEVPICPSCDDNNSCTRDRCSADTNYECKFDLIIPCDGNDICEQDEYPVSPDCPSSCDDSDECTNDNYDYILGNCVNKKKQPCCGNLKCEAGETYISCEEDCEQLLDLNVQSYRKAERIGNVEVSLEKTDFTYLSVEFRIHNLLIDESVKLNYRDYKGFYYDPFKMRVQDGNGKFYQVEYDSDLLQGWLDYTVIDKGGNKGAALLFIVPKDAENMRLVAYDKYGNKLDVESIY